MSLIDDFKTRFPEFDEDIVEAKLPLFVDTWSMYYGGDYTDATDKEVILHVLAHLLVIEMKSINASSVRVESSRTVGSVSVAFATSSQADALSDFFQTTRYGQRFLVLTSRFSGARFV